jgi:hypothetical protein
VDTDPELAQIRQELVWKFGEDIAYAIRLTAKDETPVGHPTWDPLPSYEGRYARRARRVRAGGAAGSAPSA